MDFAAIRHAHDSWVDRPGQALEPSFPREEYALRIARARALMVRHGLDALVVTTQAVGHWFTSDLEPHEWHDRCGSRSAWYILTADGDFLYMTPTAFGEHFNTTRRCTWVTHIRGIAERAAGDRVELWDLRQMPGIFAELGLARARLGFELGDCMTLGMAVNDFLALRALMPGAALVDGSAVIRNLMAVFTPLEVARLRTACAAGLWMHARVPEIVRPGMTERELQRRLTAAFHDRFGQGYTFEANESWDIRNAALGELHPYHQQTTDRVFKVGDHITRGASGVSFRGYFADVDRMCHIGPPAEVVKRYYRMTWEANRAMGERLGPGVRCSEVFAAGRAVEACYGLPPRVAGRTGHGYRNTGGLSVHPDNHTVLEPGMVISVEPMNGDVHGFYDLEDQFVITATGAECLHDRAPEDLPVVPV